MHARRTLRHDGEALARVARRLVLASLTVAALAWAPAASAVPDAAGTASTSAGPAPLAVSFGGSSSTAGPAATIVSYRWDFGDGTSAEAAQASHVYRSAGRYRATLRVTDDLGSTGAGRSTSTRSHSGSGFPREATRVLPKRSGRLRAHLAATGTASAARLVAVTPSLRYSARRRCVFLGAQLVVRVRPIVYRARVAVRVRQAGRTVALTGGWVRGGKVEAVLPVSTGATGNTPEGAWRILWKAPSTTTWLGPMFSGLTPSTRLTGMSSGLTPDALAPGGPCLRV